MKPNKDHNQFLMKEFEEINNYTRMIFTIGISWYTFFITANTFAMGLLGSDSFSSTPLSDELFATVAILFIFVNILAVAICPFAIKFCRTQDKRIKSILDTINPPKAGDTGVQSPIPLSLAIGLIRLMQLSLIGTTLFWIGFPVWSLFFD